MHGHEGPCRAAIPVPRGALADFCRRHRIRKLALFGSVLTDRFTPDSDVDVLVEFEPGTPVTFFDLYRLEQELSPLFGGRKVDLRTPEDLNRRWRDEVIRSAEVEYGAAG